MGQLPVAASQLSVPPAAADGLTYLSEHQILTDAGFYWREKDRVKVLVCRPLEAAGFVNGFSTRLAGVSPFGSEPPASAGGQNDGQLNLAGFDDDLAENIAENRHRFLAALNVDMQLATAWQVHGDAIKTIESISDIRSSDDRADALISNLKDVLVGVKTADCVPILIGDPKTSAFAAIHAGWRGTVASIAEKSIEQLAKTFKSDPANLICAIGPAACGRDYEVGQDVIDDFHNSFGAGADKYFKPTRDGHALVNLHLATKDQLVAAGVPFKNIFTAPFCTMERSDLFFSYRLEKQKDGKTGRLLSVIGPSNAEARA